MCVTNLLLFDKCEFVEVGNNSFTYIQMFDSYYTPDRLNVFVTDVCCLELAFFNRFWDGQLFMYARIGSRGLEREGAIEPLETHTWL